MKKSLYKVKSLGLSLLFSMLTLWSFAQNGVVKGVVKDDAGQPILGVSVIEKGTSNGVTTDPNGRFTISVRPNAVLEFSYIGYATQEVTPGNRSEIEVTLREDNTLVDDVVVIGYGTARKTDVTGSIASVNGDVLREFPATNITYALQNRVAGVDMQQTSSQPGAVMQVRIRGTRSLNASNDPLIVLDGVPFMGSLSDINMGDIKSMDILKDASSTAIYGSRGANGVILITTNRGSEGTPATVKYNGYVGVKTVFSKYPMMSGEKYAAMRKLANKYQNSLDESDDTDTDWQDLLYRKAMVTSHDVGISGGTRNGSYSFGGSWYRDEGVIPTQDYTRYALRGSFDQGVGKYFRFGLTTNNNYNVTNGSNVGIYNVLSMSPLASPYNEDGSLKRTVKMPGDETFVLTREVIEGLKEKWLSEQQAFGTYNNFYAEVECPWVEGLKYRVNVGLNYRTTKGGAFTGMGVNSVNDQSESTASLAHTETVNWSVENLLSYDRTFKEKHHINVVGMYSAEQTKYTRSYVAGKGIPAEYFQYYNIGRAEAENITVDPGQWNYQLSALISWMGRVMYSYDNRYMFMATVRADGSSRLAPGHRWHTYPAVSAGWNVARESFMSEVNNVDLLKLRVGYGETSNQAIDPYSTLGGLSTRPYNFGSSYATGYYVSSLPNHNLGWEYSSTWNVGLDFGFFNGRLGGTMEYYVTKTKDLLLPVSLPGTAGVGSYMANVGTTQNKGFEMTLNGTIIEDRNGWNWDASFNLAINRNKLTSLASGADRDEGNNWFVGYPIDALYDYENIGIWQEGDPYLDILEPGGNVGMIKVKYTGDYNADGTPTRAIGAEDRQVMSLEPKFNGGLSTRVSYKGFDLNIITAFRYGGKLISTLHHSSGYLNMLTGRRGQVDVDYWTPENTSGTYPLPGGIQSGDNPKYASTLGFFDASFWKVTNITLGYDFTGKSWMKKAGLKGLRFYVTIQNPFVITSSFHRETGLDPMTNSYGNENVAVQAFQRRFLTVGTNTPSTRNYLFGVNLTF